MSKRILITGSTDGIGLETAKLLISQGHQVLLHGRNSQKLESVVHQLKTEFPKGMFESYVADLSSMLQVKSLAQSVTARHKTLDVLINNAGVFKAPNPITKSGLDLRFVVNTIAPWLLTKKLLTILPTDGRVINLSSAAQSTVDLEALAGKRKLNDGEAYAQSKLGITMCTRFMADKIGSDGPAIIAINPGSFLGSKMVKEAYGRKGKDLSIGAEILVRASISGEFASASGQYFDNDQGSFAQPHPDALDQEKITQLIEALDSLIDLG
ncbi:MAG: SDR family NAD(P)-dependent oxidoreductase [Planctomycetota bacterium]